VPSAKSAFDVALKRPAIESKVDLVEQILDFIGQIASIIAI
jgi:hypothetical protein